MNVIHNLDTLVELPEFPPVQNYATEDLHLSCLRAIIIRVDEVVLHTVRGQIEDCLVPER